MLTQLIIQDVVLIDRLSLAFSDGLNVLTGETGAGKTILLDALALALGARSDSGLIRVGAEQASVTAVFSGPLSQALASLLEAQALKVDEPLILRRVVERDGKSRAFLCDQPIGVALLRQIGELLIETHGQFETHGLLDAASHRTLLDAYAGVEPLVAQTMQAHVLWKEAQDACAQARREREQARDEAAFLEAAVAELEALDPQEGEVDGLTERRTQLQHREKIVQGLAVAKQSLGDERGAVAALALAGKALARVADKAPAVAEILSLVDRLASEGQGALMQIERLAAEIEADAADLERLEERLFKLRAIARKHGKPAQDLLPLLNVLRERFALLSDHEGKERALDKTARAAQEAYFAFAEKLSQKRRKAAQALEKAVAKELPPLKLDRARLYVALTPLEKDAASPVGVERVAFLAATNLGATPAPLRKVASGGELSRFMLALKVALAKAAPVPTLIFDEVDAGLGGATAAAVGERLARLGRDVQVLVVTHSPQVAARGNSHIRVVKNAKGKVPTTNVALLSLDERLEEIARMLAGESVTPAARQAAKALLLADQRKGET